MCLSSAKKSADVHAPLNFLDQFLKIFVTLSFKYKSHKIVLLFIFKIITKVQKILGILFKKICEFSSRANH